MKLFLNLLISIILIFSLKFAHADGSLKEIEQNLSDTVITTKITAKFAQNHELNFLKISVSTNRGIVTLKGHVKDYQTLINAIKMAKLTKGVKLVIANDLDIKEVNYAITDAYITAKVEAAVLRAKIFDDQTIPLVGINASTSNGTVTLTGTVKNEKSIIAIIKRVNALWGVKKIISNLEVNKDVA